MTSFLIAFGLGGFVLPGVGWHGDLLLGADGLVEQQRFEAIEVFRSAEFADDQERVLPHVRIAAAVL